jgi:hypothetical protein
MGKEKGRVHRKSERGKARGGEGRRRKKSEWRKKQKGAGGKKGELAGQRRLGRVWEKKDNEEGSEAWVWCGVSGDRGRGRRAEQAGMAERTREVGTEKE